MPVNLQQYRGVVGAFNSCFNHNNIQNSIFHRKPNVSSITSAYFTILINFCIFLSFYLIVLFRKKIKTINLLDTKILFIQMLSTYLLGLNEVEILNRTLDLNPIFAKVFLFFTGILTAFWRTISSNLMLFAYQKLILTLASQMMMTVSKFPVISYLEQIIHLILNAEVFVFII